ncbi:Zinc finger, BED-type predicted [Ceratobasidium sp. AG-Ba]|nr:Zinc finger, BED-type predicted [Ceratobasidium sp. AG-Ba]
MTPVGDLPHKRRHVEVSEPDTFGDAEFVTSLDPHTVSHRQALRGRATKSNAADNIHFTKNHALIFNFVDVFDIVTDGIGKIDSCTLKCGICRDGDGWSWGKATKGQGSMSNMIRHMRQKHPLIWENAERADLIALGKSISMEDTSIQLTDTHSNPPEFNIDEWYRLLTRWIVTGNHAFAEVENEEFQKLMVYMTPALEGHIVKSQAIRDRVLSKKFR